MTRHRRSNIKHQTSGIPARRDDFLNFAFCFLHFDFAFSASAEKAPPSIIGPNCTFFAKEPRNDAPSNRATPGPNSNKRSSPCHRDSIPKRCVFFAKTRRRGLTYDVAHQPSQRRCQRASSGLVGTQGGAQGTLEAQVVSPVRHQRTVDEGERRETWRLARMDARPQSVLPVGRARWMLVGVVWCPEPVCGWRATHRFRTSRIGHAPDVWARAMGND
jgi:hypothetical protein